MITSARKLSQGFAPVARGDARILVLGSMPGAASLEAAQYYAFSRNVFWKIMGDLFDAGPELDYPSRLERLVENRIALWDVVEVCHRPGSLDSAISGDGLAINDFKTFFNRHPQISEVFFNGQKAAGLFRKRVVPGLLGDYKYCTLPSTSPAHAARSYASKLEAWTAIKAELPTGP